MRLVLASASKSRLQALQRAGVEPTVHVSGVDESVVPGTLPAAEQTRRLARLKAESVWSELSPGPDTVLVGCDSLLELDGAALGKPGTPEAATAMWRATRGRSGVLHTGHHVMVSRDGPPWARTRVASTTVHFADADDAEIEAYVATGEPLWAAGAFTIDGYGAALISGLQGDHLNVIGISLPLLRVVLREAGVAWHDLWTPVP